MIQFGKEAPIIFLLLYVFGDIKFLGYAHLIRMR
jgi:hypothetical protein